VAEPFQVEGKVIIEPLNTLLVAVGNKIDREWPPAIPCHDSSPTYLRGFVAIARNVFQTMLYFCRDASPKLVYAKSAAPLARVVLEALFSVTFLLEDLPGRTAWFEKAGWRAMLEDLQRYRSAYGSDPAFSEYIGRLEKHIENGKTFFRLTADEIANPTTIDRWPLPSRMKKHTTNPDLAAHFQYLEDWYYGNLSQDAHVSWLGFVRHTAGMLDLVDRDLTDDLQREKLRVVSMTCTLLLALVSEIEMNLKFGLAGRVKVLWGITNEASLMSRELHARRFEGKL
jgi:hypothetical protein